MQRFSDLPPRARWFITAVALSGVAAAAVSSLVRPPGLNPWALLFILLTACAGLVKVPLPVVGSLSLGYAFILATLMGFGLGASTLAAMLTVLTSELVSCFQGRRPPLHRIGFNTGGATLTACVAGVFYLVLGGEVGRLQLPEDLPAVLPYTLVFVLVNLGLISMVLHLTRESTATTSLVANLKWSVPGYLAGSSLAVLLNLLLANENVVALALAAPFVYLLHLAYRARTEKVEEEKRHSQQAAELYFGAIKALALAVEAKDENTEEHLHRVERYSIGIAEILGLPEGEVQALKAASLLHDVGKLAVPEYILNKPGKLTAEEMEVMKTHPAVGADILGAVPFPFPLVPIVRHHHERWDGSGYPDGLAGESIPIGARILTVVDCFDAITTDRPYRKAVTRDEALAHLLDEAGKMFDPAVVEALIQHADELEARMLREARESGIDPVPPQAAETDAAPDLPTQLETLQPLREMDREAEIFSDLTRVTELDLDFRDRLHLISVKLGALIPHRSLVVYQQDGAKGDLVARYASGQAAHHLLGHAVQIGQRMTGWAALHRKPYSGQRHRDPLQRDGSRFDLEELGSIPDIAALSTAAVAPMHHDEEFVGVLALYGDEACGSYDEETLRQLELAAGLAARTVAGPVAPALPQPAAQGRPA